MGNHQTSETTLTALLPSEEKNRTVRKQLAITHDKQFLSIDNETALLQWSSPAADDILTRIRVAIVPITLNEVSNDNDAAVPTAPLISSFFELPARTDEEVTLRTEVWDATGIPDVAIKKGLERLLLALLSEPGKSQFFFNPKITHVNFDKMLWKPDDGKFNVLFSYPTPGYNLPSVVSAKLYTPSAFNAGLAAAAAVGIGALTLKRIIPTAIPGQAEELKTKYYNDLYRLEQLRNAMIGCTDLTKLRNIMSTMMEMVDLEVDESEFAD